MPVLSLSRLTQSAHTAHQSDSWAFRFAPSVPSGNTHKRDGSICVLNFHEMDYKIRLIRKEETPLLKDFLYNAIFIPEGVTPPPMSIVDDESLQIYIRDFGKLSDDRCLVAEFNGVRL